MEIDLDDAGKFVALGQTVGSHAATPVEWPMLWIEPEEAVVPGGEPIRVPSEIEDASVGPELTAVVGTDLYRADPEEAAAGVAGFTVSNDVSATGRWPKRPGGDTVSMAYKMFPSFRPVRTEAVEMTVDEVADRRVTATIDGRRVADGSTDAFRFSIPEMIAEASAVLELHAGDLIALGEPAAEGTLRGANAVGCEIEGIGELSNPVEEPATE